MQKGEDLSSVELDSVSECCNQDGYTKGGPEQKKKKMFLIFDRLLTTWDGWRIVSPTGGGMMEKMTLQGSLQFHLLVIQHSCPHFFSSYY